MINQCLSELTKPDTNHKGDNRSRAQKHNLMSACWRGPLQLCICVFVYLGVCDVSQSLSDTFGEEKCEWTQWGSVKFPPRASSFAASDSEQKFRGTQSDTVC